MTALLASGCEHSSHPCMLMGGAVSSPGQLGVCHMPRHLSFSDIHPQHDWCMQYRRMQLQQRHNTALS